jgi:mannose-6-phosphate isomerase-like protein (cupin superfamily)
MTLRRFAPNYRNGRTHTHKVQEEVYVVIKGTGRMLLDDKVENIKQWDVIRVAPETERTFEAGPDGLELIIAGGPKPPEGDGEPKDADWPQ